MATDLAFAADALVRVWGEHITRAVRLTADRAGGTGRAALTVNLHRVVTRQRRADGVRRRDHSSLSMLDREIRK